MARSQTAPVCFVAPRILRSESSSDPGRNDDGDVLSSIERAVTGEGLDCRPVELTRSGEFVEWSALERLLIADLVIADVTVESSSVAYVLGVRQGANLRPTILIGRNVHDGTEPGYGRTSAVVLYSAGDDGAIGPVDAVHFEAALARRIGQAVAGDLPQGIPLLDATGWARGERLEHDKTDVFLERIATTTATGSRIRVAQRLDDREASIEALQALEAELFEDPSRFSDLDTGLLGVYLAYRERSAYRCMVDLYSKMPPELSATPVAKEQLALALNRLAEADTELASSQPLRDEALAVLDSLDDRVVSAETWAIRGRVHKGSYRCAAIAGDQAEASRALGRAIDSYEEAVKADVRDYFPGVNVINLRLTRGSPEDILAVTELVPVVRMAVANAPDAHSEQEKYWQAVTKLELACAAEDWAAVFDHLDAATRIDVDAWMHETTIGNLEMYRTMFDRNEEAMSHLDGVINRLSR